MTHKFNIDFVIEPSGREVSMEIESASSKQAMEEALYQLQLRPDELLHTIHAHIGRPTAA
jgi:hypothetical protein